MGCISSKEQTPVPSSAQNTMTPAKITPIMAQPIANAVPPAADKVVAVPRGGLVVTDADRAKLKLKTMRDKLNAFLIQSDLVLKRDAELALQARRDGNMATCRVIMHRRTLLQKQIRTREASAKTVLDMVDAMDDATDQKTLLRTIEKGTAAINEAMKDLSVEKVDRALGDSRAAIAYTEEIANMMSVEPDMTAEQYEAANAELDQLEEQGNVRKPAQLVKDLKNEIRPVERQLNIVEPYGGAETALEKASNIPQVPSARPAAPQVTVTNVEDVPEERTAELV